MLLIWSSAHTLTLYRCLVGLLSKLIGALTLRPWAAVLPAALRDGADERAPTVLQLWSNHWREPLTSSPCPGSAGRRGSRSGDAESDVPPFPKGLGVGWRRNFWADVGWCRAPQPGIWGAPTALVAVVVEPKIQQHAVQALAGQVFLQNTADRLINLRRYRMVEIALVGEGWHSGWATRG